MTPSRAANFDGLARVYAPLERFTFGGALARRRACFIADPRLASARRVLVLGDGDGRFTAALLERYPALEVTAVDASRAMLGELKSRVTRSSPRAALTIFQADLRTWSPPPLGFDVVVTHFFFDCLTSSELAALVTRVAPTLAPSAVWLVSEFAIPSGRTRALIARVFVRALYFVFWSVTGLSVKRLPDYQSALASAGFACARAETGVWGILRSELWEQS